MKCGRTRECRPAGIPPSNVPGTGRAHFPEDVSAGRSQVVPSPEQNVRAAQICERSLGPIGRKRINDRLKPAFRSIWFVGGGADGCLRLGFADDAETADIVTEENRKSLRIKAPIPSSGQSGLHVAHRHGIGRTGAGPDHFDHDLQRSVPRSAAAVQGRAISHRRRLQ